MLCLQFWEQRTVEKAAHSNIFPIPAHSHWFRCHANCDLGIDPFRSLALENHPAGPWKQQEKLQVLCVLGQSYC